MFDLAWSEIALIAVVALVVIGPKDLPDAVKGVARAIQKLRRMAGEFQTQVDEVAKDAGVQELRQSINEIRNFDIKGQIEKAVDRDGDLRSTFSQNPLSPDTLPPSPAWTPPASDDAIQGADAPAFVPPGVAAATAPYIQRPAATEPKLDDAPAFVPPGVVPSAAPDMNVPSVGTDAMPAATDLSSPTTANATVRPAAVSPPT
ncbi:Sec-independent protein translocase protein TatB [Humitalea sp. 24SJ18S-53]|uniref:Sec-independent protein translocase protein TatB n=1 Tax=Humitalea sp. 24SJ18S-53 TaxID=3422307 RepID=UPI003D66C1C3